MRDDRFLDALRAHFSRRRPRRWRLPGFRPAAVLVPIVRRPDGLRVTLLTRAIDGRMHSGQIAFPGGRRDEHDADATETALREAHEETGIPPDTVDVIGQLDAGPTISRYMVTPVVGLIRDVPQYLPEPREVQDVFEVPLHFLLDPVNEIRSRQPFPLSRLVPMFEYHWDGRRIWGVTGHFLHAFLVEARRLRY